MIRHITAGLFDRQDFNYTFEMLKNFFKTNLTVSLLIVLSFAIVVNNFFRFFQNKTTHQFEAWLTNYQGGFVRRGLPGEILFQLYELMNIHLGWTVFIFVCFLYLLFYLAFFNLVKKIKLNKIFIFAFFSPLAFYFPVLNSKATGQKEIIFLCFLSIFCCLLPKINKLHANYLMILIALIVGLTHDGLIFYLTYLIIPFLVFFKFKDFKNLSFSLAPITIFIFVLSILIYFFKGSEQHIIDICDSVKLFANPICKEIGHIAHLKFSISDNVAHWEGRSWRSPYFQIYSVGFILGFFPLMILYGKSKSLISITGKKFNPLFILFFPWIISFPIYYLGADWGRYLYISYVSSLIIIIFCLSNNIFHLEEKSVTIKSNIIAKILFSMLIIIYCFGLSIPICCEANFKSKIFDAVKRVVYLYNRYN